MGVTVDLLVLRLVDIELRLRERIAAHYILGPAGAAGRTPRV